MGGYITKQYVKDGAAQSCLASSNTIVSNTIAITDEDSLHFQAKVLVSAMSITNGITFQLQDSFDGTNWEDVGSASVATAAKKTYAGGTKRAVAITWASTAGSSQGDYLYVVAQNGTTFALWEDKDAAGTVPTGANYVAATNKIKVPIVTGNTNAQNATAARTAVLANAAWVANFTTSTVSTATFTATDINGGVVADPTPENTGDTGVGSITVSISIAGTDGNVNLTTDVITSTAHGYVNFQPIVYTAGTIATGGLVTATTYYVIKVDADTYKLAATQALAVAGTQIDLTSPGTGTQSTYIASFEIRMNIENSTSEGQLPIWPIARVTCTTGASDTCTVSSIVKTKRH